MYLVLYHSLQNDEFNNNVLKLSLIFKYRENVSRITTIYLYLYNIFFYDSTIFFEITLLQHLFIISY